MDKRQFLETWYQRVWEEEDLSAIAEMFKPDTLARGLVDDAHVGPDEFEAFAAAMLQLVGKAKVTIGRFVENGDWVAAVISVAATDRNTDKPVMFSGQTVAKIADGVLVESYNHFDSIGLFEQLGLLPESTFEICLMGEPIA
ncbi:ester cyclase [Aliiroseovarius sp. YM-037]|uniref:ester cyclase n=1 Tax=Aliiroseovarius sp. YM-037 TaxID=3341728 RepID=UPI003A805E99